MREIRTNNGQKASYDWDKMKPVQGALIVKWTSESATTAGGLYRPDMSIRWDIIGEVLKVGKKPADAKIDHIAEFDRVVANPLWGTLVFEGEEIDGDEKRNVVIKIIGWNDVMATVEA